MSTKAHQESLGAWNMPNRSNTVCELLQAKFISLEPLTVNMLSDL